MNIFIISTENIASNLFPCLQRWEIEAEDETEILHRIMTKTRRGQVSRHQDLRPNREGGVWLDWNISYCSIDALFMVQLGS